jgi:hypothetical protein
VVNRTPALLLVATLLICASALAKRLPPAEVAPVVHNGVRYSAPAFGDQGARCGWVEAHDVTSGKLLWEVPVYQLQIDPKLEEDVQHVFIMALELDATSNKLLISDERNRRFELDLATHAVRPIPRKAAPAAPATAPPPGETTKAPTRPASKGCSCRTGA